MTHVTPPGIPDVILKPMQSDFSMWQVIFRPNFRLIDQYLVLVWAELHIFLAIFRTIFGGIISD